MCKFGFLLLIIVFSFSCSNTFDQTGTDSDIKVLTIRTGSILAPGELLPVTLVYDEDAINFDAVKISLFDDSGKELAVKKIDRKTMGSNSRKDVDFAKNLGVGIYHIKFDVTKGDNSIYSSVTDFFCENNFYKLNAVKFYPPNPAPGEKILLMTNFTESLSAKPNGENSVQNKTSDPYLRWSIGKKIMFEGFVSEGADKYLWTAPSIEGAYSATVELFPFQPLKTAFANFSSAINTNSVVMVSESNRQKPRGFYPDSSYFLLYHFFGDMKNSGYAVVPAANAAKDISTNANSKTSAKEEIVINGILTGNPAPDFLGNIFGYYFKNNEFLQIPLLAVPVSPTGVLQPFSVKLVFMPDYAAVQENTTGKGKQVTTESAAVESAPFFKTETDDSSFAVALGQHSDGRYYAEITAGMEKQTINSTYFANNENTSVNLTLSFFPDKSSCNIIWLINGETVAAVEIPSVPAFTSVTGNTKIGAGVFPVLFDEAGIYTKDKNNKNSADVNSFFEYNYLKYSDMLVLAEGFDYAENPFKSSAAEIKKGAVYIKQGGWICLGENIRLSGNLEALITGECTFVIKDENGNKVFSKAVSNAANVKKSFTTGNIPAGNYSIYIENTNSSFIQSADNILITRTFTELAIKQ